MNLGEETIKALQSNGYSKSDILWIGGRDFRIPADNFWEIAHKTTYDSCYGAQEVASDLIIAMQDGSWFSRSEYDGSEWWEHHCRQKIPSIIKEVNYLAVDINNDEHDCGWMTLKELNKHSYYKDQRAFKIIADSISIFMI